MSSNRLVNPNTESVDNYLKAILVLSGPEERSVSSTALAQRLQVAPASVTNMLQKLAGAPSHHVVYEKHRGVRLSPQGRRRALEILRHHRLIETFLYEILDYPLEEIHEEAERLEHFISEKLEDRMAAKLGDPETDPHGHLIPEKSGAVPIRDEVPLSNWACGVPATVSSVSDRDASALREMERLGLRPGVAIVVDAGVRSASLLVRIGTRLTSARLSQRLAGLVSVIPVS